MTEHAQCLVHSAHDRAIQVHDQRLNTHSDEIDSLRECIVKLTTLQEQSLEWKKEADARITALETVPASRWEKVVGTVITGVVSAIVGAITAVIALGGV